MKTLSTLILFLSATAFAADAPKPLTDAERASFFEQAYKVRDAERLARAHADQAQKFDQQAKQLFAAYREWLTKLAGDSGCQLSTDAQWECPEQPAEEAPQEDKQP